MANHRRQKQNLQKRNRRVTRLKGSKGGSKKSIKIGSKLERAIDAFRNTHAMGGGMSSASGASPEYTPKKKKLKGWQRDHTGKKVA